jgi:alkylation response protein AidB-like acyl-CoA dehydrogenase
VRFDLTEERRSLADIVAQFLAKELPSTELRPWLGAVSGRAYRDWWRRCGGLGWSGIFAPPGTGEYGPLSEAPLLDAALVAEVSGRALCPSPLVGTSAAVAALAADPGTAASILAAVLDCTSIAAYALEEPGGVWELDELATTARVEGNELVIDGTKAMVADAGTADVLLVACHLDNGVGLVLVPAQTAGTTVHEQRGLDLLRSFGTVRFEGARVGRDALIAKADPPSVLQLATCLQLAETVGALDRLFDLTLAYARSRYAFGRPIGSFQALKHRIADLLLSVEGCKGTVDAAIDAVSAGSPDSDLLVSVAKVYVGDRCVQVAQQCTQILGGIGLTWEHDAHLYLRRVTTNRAVFGTPEQHRARIARLLDVKGQKRGEDGS